MIGIKKVEIWYENGVGNTSEEKSNLNALVIISKGI